MLKSAGWKKLVSVRGPAKQRATDGAIFLKAAKMQKLRLIRMMLDGGVDINWQNEEGYNALMCVITSHTSDVEDPQASSKYAMVDYLLKVGIDPNARDRNGKTALIHACQLNTSVDIIQLLIVCNADTNIRDFSTSTAVDYAQAQQNDAVVRLLNHACNMKKSVMFLGEESFPKDQCQMYSYLSVPKTQNVCTNDKRSIGSPKPLKRQHTVSCAGDDDFRRLWEEEIATSREKDSHTSSKHASCSSLLRRRNTATDIPTISFSEHGSNDMSKYDLDSTYYDMKRVQTSLFEWEQQSANSLNKANARHAWLDQSEKALTRGTIKPTLKVISDTEDDINDNALSLRVRSVSLNENDNGDFLKAPNLGRSKSEEHTKVRNLQRQTRVTELTPPAHKAQKVTFAPTLVNSQKSAILKSIDTKDSTLSPSLNLEIKRPVLSQISDKKPQMVTAQSKQPDVRPKHPHAKFFQSRSNTFHISSNRFKGEELVETI